MTLPTRAKEGAGKWTFQLSTLNWQELEHEPKQGLCQEEEEEEEEEGRDKNKEFLAPTAG